MDVIATAYIGDSEFDKLLTWETAVAYANEGYRVVVHRGDGHLSREELQAMVDRERELVLDCFGPEYLK